MAYVMNEIELQIALEVKKLSNLEEFLNDNKSKREIIDDDVVKISTDNHFIISEAVTSEVIKTIEESILNILRSDSSRHAERLFIDYAQAVLVSDEFKNIALSIYDRYRSRADIVKRDKLINETPQSIQLIMQQLADYGNDSKYFRGDNFYSQYFLSQFMIYKINEGRFVLDSKKISKTKLYDMVFGTLGIDSEILNKINEVQKKHKSIFKEITKTVNYETAKKRMQQAHTSQHKDGTMNQSEELNIFRQHALLIVFLIYKTSYQQFLSSPTNRAVPNSRTFEEIKKAIEEFFVKHPISEINDDLFLKTMSEDTYHFALFNALTRLTTTVLNAMNEIIVTSRKYDSLSMLFIIDQMIENTPAYTAEWIDKFEKMVTELDKVAEFPEIHQAVLDAIKDEEGLEYAHNTMLGMFDKYGTVHQEGSDFDFTEIIFKKIVKDFYTTGDEDNAYAK